jgi:hypothetical protein
MERTYENRIVNKGQVIRSGELILNLQILTPFFNRIAISRIRPFECGQCENILILCKPETRSSKVF